MHSRAFLLLRRDLIKLQKDPIPGVSAAPSHDESLFGWSARLEGVRGTVWEGGVFQLTLSFSDEFNTRPPSVHFVTIPFHPNVDPTTGRPSLHVLEAGWTEECGVATVLTALQEMLGAPELAGGCVRNIAAAKLLREAPHTYKQMALDCVTASLRVDAGLTPYELEEDEQTSPDHKAGGPPSSSSPNRARWRKAAKPVSFDDYHTLWKGIATSVTAYQQANTFAQLLSRDGHLCAVHCSDSEREETQKTFEKNLQDLSVLKYGRARPLPKLEPHARQHRMEELNHMYKQGAAATGNSNVDAMAQDSETEDIDQLVQWAQTLDGDQLEP